MTAHILRRWNFSYSFLVIYFAALATVNSFTCTWKTPDGKVIDLNPLSTGTSPRFRKSHDDLNNKHEYTWDPCRDVPCGGSPGVSVCQIADGIPNKFYFPIGDKNASTLVNDSSGLYLRYLTVSSGRTSKVFLKCNTTVSKPTFIADGEVPPGGITYEMTLVAAEACPKFEGGLSVGSILIIALCVLLVVYIVAGIIINRFVRHETGSDMFPNKAFWVGLPGLIKDGFLFLWRKIRGTSYEKV